MENRLKLLDVGPVQELMPGVAGPVYSRWTFSMHEVPDAEITLKIQFVSASRSYQVTEFEVKNPTGVGAVVTGLPFRAIIRTALLPLLENSLPGSEPGTLQMIGQYQLLPEDFVAVGLKPPNDEDPMELLPPGRDAEAGWRQNSEVSGEAAAALLQFLLARMTTPHVVARAFASEGPTDDALRHMAHVYRVHMLIGEAPTKGVQEAFGLPRSTATRWLAKARERGFLGADEVGHGGGARSRFDEPREG